MVSAIQTTVAKQPCCGGLTLSSRKELKMGSTTLPVGGVVKQLASFRDLSEGTLADLTVNPRHELVVAEGLPPGIELIRQGDSWYGKQTTSVVNLVTTAIPTTVAMAVLWNGETAGTGKSYIVTAAGCVQDVSEGAASYFQLFGELSIVTATQPATDDTAIIRGLIAGKTYGGKAKISRTVTVTDNGWWPIGHPTTATALSTTIAFAQGGRLDEPVIIPPGHFMALAVTAVNATGSGKCFFKWHEVTLPHA